MLTVKDVAQRLNVSLGAIYKAIQNNSLQHHRIGSSIRITEQQLAEFLDETRVEIEQGAFRRTKFKHL